MRKFVIVCAYWFCLAVQLYVNLAFLNLVLQALHEWVDLTLWYLEKQNLYLYFLHGQCSLIKFSWNKYKITCVINENCHYSIWYVFSYVQLNVNVQESIKFPYHEVNVFYKAILLGKWYFRNVNAAPCARTSWKGL